MGGMAAVLGADAAAAAERLGLTVHLDRPAAFYAVGDTFFLTVQTEKDAWISVWLVEAGGRLERLIPATDGGLRLRTVAGQPLRIPKRGAFPVGDPPGRYQLRVTAEAADGGGSRSLTNADSRLAGRETREEQVLTFKVEDSHH